MTTLNNRIMDLVLAGHEPGAVATLLGITDAEVLTCVQDLTQQPSANIDSVVDAPPAEH